MKHLGDITKINGAEIPVVDIITGGSPCQDLSVAGKRAGIQHSYLGDEETTRSGLFMDQLRIVKEMRESDRRKGRHGVDVRPRYMVWENVPGAFSSNGGKDFQAVLTEIARIAEPDYPDVPLPEKGGWPKAGCLYGEMGNWSIAYRVHDAQYWGVPQRRKRIALLADFNGLTAPAILFDPQLRGEAEDSEPDEAVRDSGVGGRPEVQSLSAGLSGRSEPGGEAGEGTAESPSGRSDGAGADEPGRGGDPAAGTVSFQERAGCDGGAKGYCSSLNGQEPCHLSTTNPSSPNAYGISSLDSNAMKSPNPHSGIYEADTSRTLDLNGGNPACNQGGWRLSDLPLTAGTEQKTPFVNGTLQAKEQGMNLNSNNVVRVPDQNFSKTQGLDGGTRETPQKPSERQGGRRNQSKPCPVPTPMTRNPNGSTTETERSTV